MFLTNGTNQMKTLLAKHGRNFVFFLMVCCTIFFTYEFFYNEESLSDMLMFSAFTLFFGWQGQGQKLLAKHGRNFVFFLMVCCTIFLTYDFFYNEVSFFVMLMLFALTLLFGWQGQGKLEEE